METNMILFMLDNDDNEIMLNSYIVDENIDYETLEDWKDAEITKAKLTHPEAADLYFFDMRNLNSYHMFGDMFDFVDEFLGTL